MKRALLVALAALALAAPPAGAQTPIAGGGSFNDAPVLAPGRYADTLRGGEQLFYAVTLKPGQMLTAGGTVKGRTESSYSMALQIYNPVREDDNFEGEQTASFGPADRSASLRVEGKRVGESNSGTSNDVYAEPGTYYVSLAANDRGSNLEAEQFDSSIDLQVTGEVIPEATPTARPRRRRPPRPRTRQAASAVAVTAGAESSGWPSSSASRSAGWPGSASGACGRPADGGGVRRSRPPRSRTRGSRRTPDSRRARR